MKDGGRSVLACCRDKRATFALSCIGGVWFVLLRQRTSYRLVFGLRGMRNGEENALNNSFVCNKERERSASLWKIQILFLITHTPKSISFYLTNSDAAL